MISTRDFKPDVSLVSLADIDEFSLYSDRIHVIGGLWGLLIIILDEVLKIYNYNDNPEENINFVQKIIEEFISNYLKENQFIELKYLESARFNFREITDERKSEYIEFTHDYRRFVNKSLKIILDNNLISKDIYEMILDALLRIYFKDKSSIIKAEIDTENQDPEYLEKNKKQQEKYLEQVAKLESNKKKIKFIMIKPEILKKKRENFAAMIQVIPNQITFETLVETEEVLLTQDNPVISSKLDDYQDNKTQGQVEKLNTQEVELNKLNKKPVEEILEPEENKIENENEEENLIEKEKEYEEENKIEKEKENEVENTIEKEEEIKNEEKLNNENEEEKVLTPEEIEEMELAEKKKNEPKIFKLNYCKEVQVFRNNKMKYEPYIFHQKMHEFFLYNIVRSFRKVIKREMKVNAELPDLINISMDKYQKVANFVIENIMSKEIYIKETIVPIVVEPLEVKNVDVPINHENEENKENIPNEE